MSVLTNQWRNNSGFRKAMLSLMAIGLSAGLGANAIIAGPIVLAIANYYMCGDNEACKAEVLPTIPEHVQKLIK